MNQISPICVYGIPEVVPEAVAAVCRSRLFNAVNKLLDETNLEDIQITVGTQSANQKNGQKSAEGSKDTAENKSNYDLSPERRPRQKIQTHPTFIYFRAISDRQRSRRRLTVGG